ncbi:MAG: nucleoside deaminase [Planctomycetota bacterium]
MLQHFEFDLPGWVLPFVKDRGDVYATPEDRMALVIDLSAENVKRGDGPFGAAVFDASGKLIAPGVNLVTRNNCSILHAEMVAIAIAQQTLGRYDLSDGGKENLELATSCEPCAMCFGAVPWSGVKRLLCGARKQDAEASGFDEGAKPEAWAEALKVRGIDVTVDLYRERAAEVLRRYAEGQGLIY